jgi:hypothetical protein
MSHWAEIDNTNTVIRVLVGDNNDPAGDEGYQWLIDNFGGTWIKASFNGNLRYNYPGVGYIYNEIADAFIAPMPNCEHTELTLDTNNYRWECTNTDHDVKFDET